MSSKFGFLAINFKPTSLRNAKLTVLAGNLELSLISLGVRGPLIVSMPRTTRALRGISVNISRESPLSYKLFVCKRTISMCVTPCVQNDASSCGVLRVFPNCPVQKRSEILLLLKMSFSSFVADE
jgi:hypothetical protein